MASTLLLRLGVEKEPAKNRDVALVVLNKFVELSPFLTADNLEQFLPFSMVRCAYHNLYAVGGGRGRMEGAYTIFHFRLFPLRKRPRPRRPARRRWRKFNGILCAKKVHLSLCTGGNSQVHENIEISTPQKLVVVVDERRRSLSLLCPQGGGAPCGGGSASPDAYLCG